MDTFRSLNACLQPFFTEYQIDAVLGVENSYAYGDAADEGILAVLTAHELKTYDVPLSQAAAASTITAALVSQRYGQSTRRHRLTKSRDSQAQARLIFRAPRATCPQVPVSQCQSAPWAARWRPP